MIARSAVSSAWANRELVSRFLPTSPSHFLRRYSSSCLPLPLLSRKRGWNCIPPLTAERKSCPLKCDSILTNYELSRRIPPRSAETIGYRVYCKARDVSRMDRYRWCRKQNRCRWNYLIERLGDSFEGARPFSRCWFVIHYVYLALPLFSLANGVCGCFVSVIALEQANRRRKVQYELGIPLSVLCEYARSGNCFAKLLRNVAWLLDCGVLVRR